MSQHDLEILASDANTGISFRVAVNAALQALGSCSSGGTAPTTPYPYQLWADTTNNLLKQRNGANTVWLTIGTLDVANWGLLALTGGTLTGVLTLSGNPTSALHAAAKQYVDALYNAQATKTGAYTAVATDCVLLGDATSAAFAFTLPTAVGLKGKTFIFKKVDSSANAITLTPAGTEKIDGASNFVLTKFHQYIAIQSDNVDWRIVGGLPIQPVIGNFTNAPHTHNDAASGGQIPKALAWGNFNGTTGTLLSGYNVSVGRNDTGDYAVSFTSALPNANYIVVFGFQNRPLIADWIAPTVNGFSMHIANSSSSFLTDPSNQVGFLVYG